MSMAGNPYKLFIIAFVAFRPVIANAEAYFCEYTEKPTLVEKTICKTEKLSEYDDQLNKLFYEKSRTVNFINYLNYSQNKWLKEERDRCKEISCIESSYRKRINELESWEDKGRSVSFNIQGIWKQERHIPTFNSNLVVENGTIEWEGYCKKTKFRIVNNYTDVYLDDWAHVTIYLEGAGGKNCVFNQIPYVEFSLASYDSHYDNQLGKIDFFQSYEKRKAGYHNEIELFHYDKNH